MRPVTGFRGATPKQVRNETTQGLEVQVWLVPAPMMPGNWVWESVVLDRSIFNLNNPNNRSWGAGADC